MIIEEEISNTQSCLNRARPGEMVFVLLARDEAAPAAIRAWIAQRIILGNNFCGDQQLVDALNCAREMEKQRRDFLAPKEEQIAWAIYHTPSGEMIDISIIKPDDAPDLTFEPLFRRK